MNVVPLLQMPQYFPHRSRNIQNSLKTYAQSSLNYYEVNKVNADYVGEQSKALDNYFRLKLVNSEWEIEANLPFDALCTDFKVLNVINKIVFMYKVHIKQTKELKVSVQELLSNLKIEKKRVG